MADRPLNRYLQEALKLTVLKKLDNGAIFAEIPGFDGVWASDQDLASCIVQLREVLFDWLVIKIEHGDHDIPVVADIFAGCTLEQLARAQAVDPVKNPATAFAGLWTEENEVDQFVEEIYRHRR